MAVAIVISGYHGIMKIFRGFIGVLGRYQRISGGFIGVLGEVSVDFRVFYLSFGEVSAGFRGVYWGTGVVSGGFKGFQGVLGGIIIWDSETYIWGFQDGIERFWVSKRIKNFCVFLNQSKAFNPLTNKPKLLQKSITINSINPIQKLVH